MKIENTHNAARITVVDALRGFALVSIMLLHNIEMFEVAAVNPALPQWMLSLDKMVWDSFFFLFGGKSYAIFALLFGLTFFIQSKNRDAEGSDFNFRFMWRMILLIGFGFINTMFYRGEILVLYAILGLFLIPFKTLSNKALLIFASVLLLQPILLVRLVMAIQNPDIAPAMPSFIPFYAKSGDFLAGTSFLELVKSNVTNGRIASLLWYFEYGRIEQTLALFLLGFLAGRKRIFYNTPENIKFWKRTLVISALIFIPFFHFKSNSDVFTDSENIRKYISAILNLWANFAFMLFLASGFILLFYNKRIQPTLNLLSPIGKMSLTNYILQSVVGACVYYGFGLAIYRYVGATYCLLIGILLTIGMYHFSNYWMKNHKRGLMETVWHRLTWIGTDKR